MSDPYFPLSAFVSICQTILFVKCSVKNNSRLVKKDSISHFGRACQKHECSHLLGLYLKLCHIKIISMLHFGVNFKIRDYNIRITIGMPIISPVLDTYCTAYFKSIREKSLPKCWCPPLPPVFWAFVENFFGPA